MVACMGHLRHRQYVGIAFLYRGSQEALPPTPLLIVKCLQQPAYCHVKM